MLDAPFKTYYLPYVSIHWRLEIIYRILSFIPATLLGLFLLIKYKPKSILVFYPFENALFTAYLLRLISGTPIYPYLNDLYLENRTGLMKHLAVFLQPRLFKKAEKIIVVNEGMNTFYQNKLNIHTEVIFTSINEHIPTKVVVPEITGRFILGYSGNINNDRIDVFKTMVAALGKREDVEIRLFTGTTQKELEMQEAWSDNMSIKFIKKADELVHELGLCHALYLPLTFSTTGTPVDQLATCLGIKSYEYLICGAPVIVQCPLEYYTSQFYIDRNCGMVIGENTTEALLEGITELKKNKTLRQELVNNSLIAAAEFTGQKNAEKLLNIIA